MDFHQHFLIRFDTLGGVGTLIHHKCLEFISYRSKNSPILTETKGEGLLICIFADSLASFISAEHPAVPRLAPSFLLQNIFYCF